MQTGMDIHKMHGDHEPDACVVNVMTEEDTGHKLDLCASW